MDLKPCPHCGGQPWFGDIREKDDRRYIQMTLECCSTLYGSISWPNFDKMTAAEQNKELRAQLTDDWNKRTSLPGEITADQLDKLIGRWDGVYVEGVDTSYDIGKKLREQLAKILEDQ